MTDRTCLCGATIFGNSSVCFKCGAKIPENLPGFEVTYHDRRKEARRADDNETELYTAYGKLELNYEADDICTVTLRCSTCRTVFVSMSTPANPKVAALPLSALAHTCATKVRP